MRKKVKKFRIRHLEIVCDLYNMRMLSGKQCQLTLKATGNWLDKLSPQILHFFRVRLFLL